LVTRVCDWAAFVVSSRCAGGTVFGGLGSRPLSRMHLRRAGL